MCCSCCLGTVHWKSNLCAILPSVLSTVNSSKISESRVRRSRLRAFEVSAMHVQLQARGLPSASTQAWRETTESTSNRWLTGPPFCAEQRGTLATSSHILLVQTPYVSSVCMPKSPLHGRFEPVQLQQSSLVKGGEITWQVLMVSFILVSLAKRR